ncbi:4-amino-4-deoxy-L-arabinose transferase-like glycosyltransferase [Neorhizobium galegae]|uniref:ArnT family glycosyltransferase n=1 Tax=Neorhizobium galegae TaxID=399 RepID=UPI001AEAE0D5|nr:4-amino-4-deoxy-L-arabinose transferase-like glycosyltransferase [Neorhizobium galegae]
MSTRIHKFLVRRPDIVIWLVLGYFVLCVLLRVIRSDSLQNDEAEQAFQAQMLLLGYGRQPPLYNWLQYGVVHVFGLSVATISLLKNGLLFLCCLFYLVAARIVVRDRRLPFVAMLGVLAVPSVTVLAQRDLTHAVGTLCLVSLFLCALLSVLKRPGLFGYLALGVTVGFGIITKYNFVILPVAAILAMLTDAQFRRRLFDWRVIPAVLIAIAIVTPHLVWVLYHLDLATTGTVQAMHDGASGNAAKDTMRGLISILESTLAGSVPVLALFALVFYRDIGAAFRAQSRWTRLIGGMIIASLILVALIGIGFGASSIRQKWLSPFLLLLPLYLVLKFDAIEGDMRQSVARMAPPLLGIVTAFSLYLALSNLIGPLIGDYGKEHIPYRSFVEQVVKERGERPAYVITDDLMLAGNLRLQWPDVPVIMPGTPLPVSLESAGQSGSGLIAWPAKGGEPLPASAAVLLAAHGLILDANVGARQMAVPYLFSRGRATFPFGYAFVKQAPLPVR